MGTGTWYIDTLNDLYPKTSAGNTRHIAASATFVAQTRRYVYYGRMKRSEVDDSLNHDVVASFSLHKWPLLPKSGANLAGVTI